MRERSALLQELLREALEARQDDSKRSPQVGSKQAVHCAAGLVQRVA